jgi:signal transduction histidine kinase
MVAKPLSSDPLPALAPDRPPWPIRRRKAGRRTNDAFLEVLSHELRTPVTSIYMAAQVIVGRDVTQERIRAVADDIHIEAERLFRLVEDLVVLGRLDGGSLVPDDEPVLIGRAVQDAIDREAVVAGGVAIGFSGPRDATAASADRLLVTHVIRNLLDNAIRFGDARPVDVRVELHPEEVGVRVLDRGVGPGAHGSGAFDIGERAPVARAQRAGGGIGLFVARGLVRAMGGRVWARPRAGGGSEFGFALPRTV